MTWAGVVQGALLPFGLEAHEHYWVRGRLKPQPPARGASRKTSSPSASSRFPCSATGQRSQLHMRVWARCGLVSSMSYQPSPMRPADEHAHADGAGLVAFAEELAEHRTEGC